MFQYIYDIYVSGLIYAVPTALILSIVSIPEFKRELAFKYLLGYTATGLCIGYTYPISSPLLSIYLLKDFEKDKNIREMKKENLKCNMEQELKLKMEREDNLEKLKMEYEDLNMKYDDLKMVNDDLKMEKIEYIKMRLKTEKKNINRFIW